MCILRLGLSTQTDTSFGFHRSSRGTVRLILRWLLQLYAELDILVLRPEAPGAVIVHSGDVDNQLKTLFDALRRPAEASEAPVSWTSTEDESRYTAYSTMTSSLRE